MELPFDTIVHTSFLDMTPDQGLVTFELARPPTFFLEEVAPPTTPLMSPGASPGAGGAGAGGASAVGAAARGAKVWKKCADWTEGMQASSVLRHELIGSGPHLMHFIQQLRETRPSPVQQPYISPVSAYPSSADGGGGVGSGVGGGGPLRLPHIPLDARRPDLFGLQQDRGGIAAANNHNHNSPAGLLETGRKRAFSTPATFNPVGVGQHLPTVNEEDQSTGGVGREASEPLGYAPATSYAAHVQQQQQQQQQQQPAGHMINPPSLLPDYLIPSLSASASPHPHPHLPPPLQQAFAPGDYSTVPISHHSMEAQAQVQVQARSYPVPTSTSQAGALADYYYDPGPPPPLAPATVSVGAGAGLLHRRSAPDLLAHQAYNPYAAVDTSAPPFLQRGYAPHPHQAHQAGNIVIPPHPDNSQQQQQQHQQQQQQHRAHLHHHLDDASSLTSGMDPSSISVNNMQYPASETHQ